MHPSKGVGLLRNQPEMTERESATSIVGWPSANPGLLVEDLLRDDLGTLSRFCHVLKDPQTTYVPDVSGRLPAALCVLNV